MKPIDVERKDMGVQVGDTRIEVELVVLTLKLQKAEFRLSNKAHSNDKVQFYTYAMLMTVYKMLGPAVDCLNYWSIQ